MVLLCLIPILATVIYAVSIQLRLRNTLNVFLVIAGGFIVLFNALFMYEFFVEKMISTSIRCMQQIVACMIVPIAYMYFSAQMGRNWQNSITMTLWALVLLLILPSGLYPLDFVTPRIEESTVTPMMLRFYFSGNEIFRMYTADLIVMTQAIVTLARMFVMGNTMRRYHLIISPRMRYFIIWWAATIIFIIFTSIHTTEEFREPMMLWTYYIGYSALSTAIFLLISLNFNLHPILQAIRDYDEDNESTEERENDNTKDNYEGEVIENVDTFLMQSHMMAERLKQIIEKDHRYLDTSLTADAIIDELGTNRTYFYRMIKAEYGRTFSELLTTRRMEHAAMMLTTTHNSIEEISHCCGFSDHTSFSRRFRSHFGVSPSKYRETKIILKG